MLNNHDCVKYVRKEMRWADAEINCREKGANLVDNRSYDDLIKFYQEIVVPKNKNRELLFILFNYQ